MKPGSSSKRGLVLVYYAFSDIMSERSLGVLRQNGFWKKVVPSNSVIAALISQSRELASIVNSL